MNFEQNELSRNCLLATLTIQPLVLPSPQSASAETLLLLLEQNASELRYRHHQHSIGWDPTRIHSRQAARALDRTSQRSTYHHPDRLAGQTARLVPVGGLEEYKQALSHLCEVRRELRQQLLLQLPAKDQPGLELVSAEYRLRALPDDCLHYSAYAQEMRDKALKHRWNSRHTVSGAEYFSSQSQLERWAPRPR